jgi:hypothetical protein
MSNKVIHAIYNDDDILMDAVKARAAHHHIEEVFTFPVHGLMKSNGISNQQDLCFIYGIGLQLQLQ